MCCPDFVRGNLPHQVFLREAERQRLQALLHREVFSRIVLLQRQFRARLERKQFVRMREAAVCIQVRNGAFSPSLLWNLCMLYFDLCLLCDLIFSTSLVLGDSLVTVLNFKFRILLSQ